MNKTPNLFCEYMGNADKGTLGGPWRAAKDKVDYFVYYYVNDKTFLWYKSVPLVAFLDGWIKGKKPKEIRNKSYTTLGFAVPRDDVAHLLEPEPPRK